MPFGLGKILLGALVGFFVIPAMINDPEQTLIDAQNIIGKLIQVATYLSEVVNV